MLIKRLIIGMIFGHHNASHGVGVAAHILGGAMHYEIGAMLQRAAEIGCGKGVVHDQLGTMRVGDFRTGVNVADLQQWIGNGLGN